MQSLKRSLERFAHLAAPRYVIGMSKFLPSRFEYFLNDKQATESQIINSIEKGPVRITTRTGLNRGVIEVDTNVTDNEFHTHVCVAIF